MSINFGTPLKDKTEDELQALIDNASPQHGMMAQYELLRRLSLEDSKTSKRFAKSSLFIAIIAIIISIALGIVQICKIQEVKIMNETLRAEITNFP